MADLTPPPIIIVKKKGGHGGHHGGAWKVAYADFVTAMMALFIVLWLLSSDEQVKKAVGGYFLDPSGNGNLAGSSMAGSGGEALAVATDDMEQLKEKIEQTLKKAPQFQKLKDNVQIQIVGEGLRIELLEKEGGMFFDSGSARPSKNGEDLLGRLAAELGKLPNEIVMEGHTDAKPFDDSHTYTNWELSADRANAARRLMEGAGLRDGQVTQIRGFAAQHPRTPEDPFNPSNRRISVIVRYLHQPPAGPKAESQSAGHGEAAHAPEHAAEKPAH